MLAAKKSPVDPSKIRGEFRAVTNDFAKVNDAFARIVASAEDPSAAGDLALIFNYMKVLDPGSTVREGEFATAQNAAGVDKRIQAQYNNILRGERMTPEQREDFVNRGARLYDKALEGYDKTADEFRRIASASNADEALAVFERATMRDYQVPTETPQEEYPTPQTQAEFDALPAGSVYIDPDDGKQYRKD